MSEEINLILINHYSLNILVKLWVELKNSGAKVTCDNKSMGLKNLKCIPLSFFSVFRRVSTTLHVLTDGIDILFWCWSTLICDLRHGDFEEQHRKFKFCHRLRKTPLDFGNTKESVVWFYNVHFEGIGVVYT